MSKADYAIHNALFPDKPALVFEGDPITLLSEDGMVLSPFRVNPNFETDDPWHPYQTITSDGRFIVDMEEVYLTAESEYPEEYEGRHPFSFYQQ